MTELLRDFERKSTPSQTCEQPLFLFCLCKRFPALVRGQNTLIATTPDQVSCNLASQQPGQWYLFCRPFQLTSGIQEVSEPVRLEISHERRDGDAWSRPC